MSSVLDRAKNLLALTTSPNENEARTAALVLAKLIREHKLVLAMPRHTTPNRAAPSAKKRSSSSKRGVRRVADPPERITSPLGGECIHCGTRYKAGSTIYWFSAGGGLHARCFEEWAKKEE
jgi:Protein of unknown function (DUF2786)